ncbi:MAG: response regulator transcription factor [Verrucomicrobiota bacterium]
MSVTNAEYWKRRLIHRKYLEPPNSKADREFSVRIEHTGTSHYFPLGTDDETEAASRAMRIYQTVVNHGWARTTADFPRELTLALRWLNNPVAWTYATFHTQKRSDPIRSDVEQPKQSPELMLAVIEPDDGIRFALAACANSQNGIRCDVTFTSEIEALREIHRHQLHLIMINHILPDGTGAECLEAVQRTTPQLDGLLYSVYEDSDKLFASVPGGATGYLLKRTSPFRILEPLGELAGPLTREHIAARIREYFRNLLAALPISPSSLELAKLTPREHEILTFLSKGRVAKEIAHSLGISLWTVHGHVKNIFEKLHVHTRTEAVLKFLQK